MQRQAERLAGGALPRELATMMYNDTYFPTQWAAGDELLAPGLGLTGERGGQGSGSPHLRMAPVWQPQDTCVKEGGNVWRLWVPSSSGSAAPLCSCAPRFHCSQSAWLAPGGRRLPCLRGAHAPAKAHSITMCHLLKRGVKMSGPGRSQQICRFWLGSLS
eukprot:1159048-Pelagomonas_calceolata.AAC.3